jgi:acylphosphatase
MNFMARIEGTKIHQVGYRMLLTNRAIDLDLQGFSAQNRIENGRQVVLVFFEGDEGQVGEFKRFLEANKPPAADVSSIVFQEYQGPVGDTMLFSQKISSQHLSKGIDAILRMEKKQDRMIDLQVQTLDKQAEMLDKQAEMLDKQETTVSVLKEVKEDTSSIRNDISGLKKDAIDSILEKYFELSREIVEIKSTLSEIKAKVS